MQELRDMMGNVKHEVRDYRWSVKHKGTDAKGSLTNAKTPGGIPHKLNDTTGE